MIRAQMICPAPCMPYNFIGIPQADKPRYCNKAGRPCQSHWLVLLEFGGMVAVNHAVVNII